MSATKKLYISEEDVTSAEIAAEAHQIYLENAIKKHNKGKLIKGSILTPKEQSAISQEHKTIQEYLKNLKGAKDKLKVNKELDPYEEAALEREKKENKTDNDVLNIVKNNKSFFKSGKPLEAPAKAEEPVKVEKPLEAPTKVEKPVKAPTKVENPVKAPAKAEEPVETPAKVENPVKAPAKRSVKKTGQLDLFNKKITTPLSTVNKSESPKEDEKPKNPSGSPEQTSIDFSEKPVKSFLRKRVTKKKTTVPEDDITAGFSANVKKEREEYQKNIKAKQERKESRKSRIAKFSSLLKKIRKGQLNLFDPEKVSSLAKINKTSDKPEEEPNTKSVSAGQTSFDFSKKIEQKPKVVAKRKTASSVLKKVATASKVKEQPEEDLAAKGYTNVPVKRKPSITITHTPTQDEKDRSKRSQVTPIFPRPKSKVQRFGEFIKSSAKKLSSKVQSAIGRAKGNISKKKNITIGDVSKYSGKDKKAEVPESPKASAPSQVSSDKPYTIHHFNVQFTHPETGKIEHGRYRIGLTNEKDVDHNSDKIKDYAQKLALKGLEKKGFKIHAIEHGGIGDLPPVSPLKSVTNTEQVESPLQNTKKKSTTLKENILTKLRSDKNHLTENQKGFTPYDIPSSTEEPRGDSADLSYARYQAAKGEKYWDEEHGEVPNYGAYIHYHGGMHNEPVYVDAGDETEAKKKVRKLVDDNSSHFNNKTSKDIRGITVYSADRERPYKVTTGHVDNSGSIKSKTRIVYHDHKQGAHDIAEIMHVHDHNLSPSTIMDSTTSRVMPKEKKREIKKK